MLDRRTLVLLSAAVTPLFAACGTASSTPDGSTGGGDLSEPAEVQNPPTTGFADVEAWLAKGYYKTWHCEPTPHAARSPSPHGINRICNNAKVQAQPAGPGEYPVGAANVKELYDMTGAMIVGYAVEVHISAGKDTSNWYWYERDPLLGAPAKNGHAGVVGDGVGPNEGVMGATDQVCTNCHKAAGSDAAHTTTDSHDFVYTHVP